jgi:hypothetical protein
MTPIEPAVLAEKIFYVWAVRHKITGNEWPGMWKVEPSSKADAIPDSERERWTAFAATVLDAHEQGMMAA